MPLTMELTKTIACCPLRGIFLFYFCSCFCLCSFFYVMTYWMSPRPLKLPVVNVNDFPAACDTILSEADLSDGDMPRFVMKGCTLRIFSQRTAQACMKKISKQYGYNRIELIGDSRIRRLFVGLTRILGKQLTISREVRHIGHHSYYSDIHTYVNYRFRGQMNDTILWDYITIGETPAILRPHVIIQGNALWDLLLGGPFNVSFTNFKANLTGILPHMKKVTKTTDIVWMLQDPTTLFSQQNKSLDWVHPLDAYNKMAVELLSPSPIKLWPSVRKVALRFPNENEDGVHYSDLVIDYKVQLFLNWYCCRHRIDPDGVSDTNLSSTS